ncbi:prephenate dehydrogenase [Stackebrandtia endophytica]|uniref:Prephenate dehydrogenase n=1 Tax=Stackebrandtia endophytica TaxID=1496996 RepID=A0A543AQA8_9ACTN|nr:prephenate dehydrogenase/arogenate dehydrogenase family protein [Stackebrandtia endophytica]TQL74773.1 prephenate dehydrogenase [Stackebrandtia endophytica]
MRVRSLRFGVVGTGLIGGSLLRRLVDTDIEVHGWDPDGETLEFAQRHALPVTGDLAEAVADRDIVILATPLSVLPHILERITDHIGPDTVITDVGSTKSGVAAAAAKSPLRDRFVPGHPMAGTEHSGLSAARAGLFDGATWVLCPDSVARIGHVRTLITVITTVFNARVTLMSPDRHDSTVALSSHVPHLLAGSLAGAARASGDEDAVLGLAAGSFTDGTRVAGTAPARTVDMLTANRDAVLAQLALVQNHLSDMAQALTADDARGLTALFAQARQVRTRLTTRADRPATHRFDPADPDGEFAFLMGTGAQGVGLTDCTVTDDAIVYSSLG